MKLGIVGSKHFNIIGNEDLITYALDILEPKSIIINNVFSIDNSLKDILKKYCKFLTIYHPKLNNEIRMSFGSGYGWLDLIDAFQNMCYDIALESDNLLILDWFNDKDMITKCVISHFNKKKKSGDIHFIWEM